jgi:Transposase
VPVTRTPRWRARSTPAHRRRGELATVVSDLDRRRVIEVLDGRSRQVVERYRQELPEPDRRSIEVVSIDPYDAYRQAIRAQLPKARIVVDHFHLVRGANTALDAVRRECRQRRARRPKGTRRSGQHLSWRQDLFHARHRLLRAREKLTTRQRRQLYELFEREPVLAEAWGLKEAFRSIYRSPRRHEAERRLDAFPGPDRSRTGPVLHRVRGGPTTVARGAAGLLRAANHQRIRRRGHQQGQSHQTPRLRTYPPLLASASASS